MQRKLHWGIAALIIVLIAAGGFIYYQWSGVQQFKEELAQDEIQLEEQHKGVAENDLPPAKPGFKWVPDGDHWHEMPLSAQRPINASVERTLTKEQIAEVQKFWKDLGLKPPPKGYGYEWDENGKATLFQFNVPRFEVKWSTKEVPGEDYYKLTDEEWARHRVLIHIINQTHLILDQELLTLVREGKPLPPVEYAPGVVELAKEWLAELERKASGPVPTVSTSVTWTRQPTEKEEQEIERKEYELLNSLEKPPRPHSGSMDENYIAEIVSNLEAEIQRR
ncbi:MAG: hypothetical protein OXI67_14365 [Candidatus Poribacteria bacterium]|nr:hypothetical protein [Candidatus Poribacteria bacterium]